MVKLLLEQKGIDVNAKDDVDGQTALITAVKNEYTQIVKLLLAYKKTDVNTKDVIDQTPLMIASDKGNVEIVKLLLEQEGIDVNAKDEGQTALILASFHTDNKYN